MCGSVDESFRECAPDRWVSVGGCFDRAPRPLPSWRLRPKRLRLDRTRTSLSGWVWSSGFWGTGKRDQGKLISELEAWNTSPEEWMEAPPGCSPSFFRWPMQIGFPVSREADSSSLRKPWVHRSNLFAKHSIPRFSMYCTNANKKIPPATTSMYAKMTVTSVVSRIGMEYCPPNSPLFKHWNVLQKQTGPKQVVWDTGSWGERS